LPHSEPKKGVEDIHLSEWEGGWHGGKRKGGLSILHTPSEGGKRESPAGALFPGKDRGR